MTTGQLPGPFFSKSLRCNGRWWPITRVAQNRVVHARLDLLAEFCNVPRIKAPNRWATAEQFEFPNPLSALCPYPIGNPLQVDRSCPNRSFTTNDLILEEFHSLTKVQVNRVTAAPAPCFHPLLIAHLQ